MRLVQSRFTLLDRRFTHFNPAVIWQDWRSGGANISNEQRAQLLQRTTSYKQSRLFAPLKPVYRIAENVLGQFHLADNLALVLRKSSAD